MDTDKRPIYPIQVWDITETEFDIKNNYRNETTLPCLMVILEQEELLRKPMILT